MMPETAREEIMQVLQAAAQGNPRYWLERPFIPRMVLWQVLMEDIRAILDRCISYQDKADVMQAGVAAATD